MYQETAFPEKVADRMMVMTAVTKTQIATWDKKARHGLFTHHLLDALYGKADENGDRKVTAAEAKDYLDRHMTASAWLFNRRVQQATLRGTGGVVLARADHSGAYPARPVLAVEGGAEQEVTKAGSGTEHAAMEAGLGLKREGKVLIQEGLAAMRYEIGFVDGLFGKRTRGAVEAWQEAKGFAATGYLTAEQAQALKAAGEGIRREREERARKARERARLEAREAREKKEEERKAEERAKQKREAREAAERERLALEARERKEAERKAREQAERERMRPGREFRDCAGCPEMVVVSAGEYTMGSQSWEGYDNEWPPHRVEIGRPFAVGKYEVTFGEWDACVAGGGCGGYRPDDEGWGRGRQPVVNVSWDDAKAYVRWLRRKTREEYGLLSEAEWEYVARAGTRTKYWWGSSIGQKPCELRRVRESVGQSSDCTRGVVRGKWVWIA